MPKHEPLTAKAIGKQIKSKGLQNLKYFCQMCQKQCRDANCFKCHMTSEAHQRQLLLVAENPGQYLGGYSDEFLKDFMYLFRTMFGTRRVLANQVYQEYIKDRNHIHMNATRWCTLTGLCKWMGRKGIAHVEENEKGWYITYIDRDPETLKRQENLSKKEKMEKDYEDRMAKVIEEQVERGKLLDKPSTSSESPDQPQELKREDEDEKIAFTLPSLKIKDSKLEHSQDNSIVSEKTNVFTESKKNVKSEKRKSNSDQRKSALDEIIEEEERKKAKKFRRDYWLEPDIVVKIVSKKLGDKYYKEKGIVLNVENKYTAIVEIIESGDRLKLDQDHLETVILQVGRLVKVVNGSYAGCTAVLNEVDFDRYCCTIKLDSGPRKGTVLDNVKYDDISKLAT